jgi:RNA-directed DNA polymerase
VDPVRALQHTLYRSAKADPGRRFHALRDKIYRRDVLWRAWVAVRRNNGAPGVDGTTLAEVEEYGVDRFLDELAEDLRADRWRPLPARRVLIPKPGTSEQRPLSIPSVRDRVVAAAVKIVLEPIFEAGFLSCSFGFRPKRSTHDALQVLIDESWQGKRWVVETDRQLFGCIVTLRFSLIVMVRTVLAGWVVAGYAGLFGVRCGRARLAVRRA